MNDREKVIKGLECCRDCLDMGCEVSCYSEDCPYKGKWNCIPELCSDALNLLKEQKAVPVIQREVAHMLFWCCSSCGVAITDGDKFCRNCGKELKRE